MTQFFCPTGEKCKAEGPYSDCNYSYKASTLVGLWVMTPSLSHCPSEAQMSGRIINGRKNMQDAHSPAWPLRMLLLNSQKGNIDCWYNATNAHEIPQDSNYYLGQGRR